MMQLLNTKSVLKGEITPEEIKSLISKLKFQDSSMIRAHLEDITHFEEDTLVCESDLELDGDFELFKNKICNLIVLGNLTIKGTFEHYDDPATLVVVGKDLKAKNLITAGTLVVFGNLEVENNLIGDYNDYSAEIHGNINASFFYPEEHYFEVMGETNFKHAYGNTWRLNNSDNSVQFMSNKEAYHLFHNEFLVEPVATEILNELNDDDSFFDYLDSRIMIKRIRNNEPIFKN